MATVYACMTRQIGRASIYPLEGKVTLSNQPYGILNRSGSYATAIGRDVTSLVVPGEGVEDGDRVLVSDE